VRQGVACVGALLVKVFGMMSLRCEGLRCEGTNTSVEEGRLKETAETSLAVSCMKPLSSRVHRDMHYTTL
jgi:hypothetical protein